MSKTLQKDISFSLKVQMVAGKNQYVSMPASLFKKSLFWCLPVNFAEFLRTPSFTEHLRWLLLNWVKNLQSFFFEYPFYNIVVKRFSFILKANFWFTKKRVI